MNHPIAYLASLLNVSPHIKIVNVGASPQPNLPTPYASLLEQGLAQVVGFDPNAGAIDILNEIKGPSEAYLPYAIGDGKRHTLRICKDCGMTSLLQPNPDVLARFQFLADAGTVVRTEEVDTVRLDDIPETASLDYLAIDIQGAELMVFQNATERLRNAVIVHAEVEFLPLYVGQPLFSDVDQFMRQQGFMLHYFRPLVSRAILPLYRNDDQPNKGFGQLVWGDALFIKDIFNLHRLGTEQLLKLALILHDCYYSYDVALHLLSEYDRRMGTRHSATYLNGVAGVRKKIA